MFQRAVPLLAAIVSAGSVLVMGCDAPNDRANGASDPTPASSSELDVNSAPEPFWYWRASFQAGAYQNEQLWLLRSEGAPEALPAIGDDPASTQLHGTYGYEDATGHIISTLFDEKYGRLIVAAREPEGSVVRSLNFFTREWTRLDLTGEPTLRNTDYGPVILSTKGDELTVTGTTARAEFETIARLTLPAGTFAEDLPIVRYTGADRASTRLLLGGIGEFERRRHGPWQPVPSQLPSGTPLIWAEDSSNGERYCAVATDGSGWLVDADGAHSVELPFAGARCGFAPDGERATYTGAPGVSPLRITDGKGAPLADFPALYLHPKTTIDHFTYGTTGKNLVRLDWQTLKLTTLPSPAGWCESGGQDATAFHEVKLLSSVALVEQHCSCTDCHHSGVYLLPFSPGAAPQPVLPPSEWQILQIEPLVGGSALIARSWRTSASAFEGGDRFLEVSGDGSVTEVGPFPDLATPLHAPVAVSLGER